MRHVPSALPIKTAVTGATVAALCATVLAITTTAPAHADTTPSPSPSSSASVDTSTLLDPTSDSALLNLLGEQNVGYFPETRLRDVLNFADADTTLVIDDDERFDASALNLLTSGGFGRVVILNNDAATIDAFFPGARVGKYTDDLTAPVAPSCTQPDALAAGSVDLHTSSATFDLSALSATDDTVVGCYPVAGAPTMIDGTVSTTRVIALGSATFLENDRLTSAGNAALALRLFGAHSRLVWFAAQFVPDPSLNNCGGVVCGSGVGTPQPGTTTTATAGGGGGSSANRPTLTSLMPTWIWWALLQLLVAVLLIAYWRGRRLGAVVSEQLPVAVRASVTVEGHARLYRRANAHGRAAELLRKASASRLAGYFGVPAARAHADPSVLVAPVAARLQVTEDLVADLLTGQAPQSEAELVLLADHLDQLEQEVRSS